MDARSQLRRYLEQRRDAGDQELILDTMSIDEVMRVLGALKARPADTAVPIPVTPRPPAPSLPPASPSVAPPSVAPSSVAPSSVAPSSVALPSVASRSAAPPSVASPSVAPPSVASRSAASPSVAPRPTASPPAAPLPVVSPGQPIVIGTAGAELFGGGPHAALATLDDVAAAATVCTRCSLYQTATHCVPGEGSAQAKLVCVGEAPGETEDQTGRPFVGKAGQLLTKILAAIDVKREDAFIVNVLKHRPPGNRNPLPTEVAACSPFLVRQIELLRPKVILALGTFAAQTLLESKLSIGKLRGTIHRYYGVPLIVTYHPAALLRNPGWKRPAWEDVQQARRLLDATAPDGA